MTYKPTTGNPNISYTLPSKDRPNQKTKIRYVPFPAKVAPAGAGPSTSAGYQVESRPMNFDSTVWFFENEGKQNISRVPKSGATHQLLRPCTCTCTHERVDVSCSMDVFQSGTAPIRGTCCDEV